MICFFKKYQKNIFQFSLIFLISSLGIFILANNVQAGILGEIGDGVKNGILYLIGEFLGICIQFLGIVVAWIVGLLKGVMEFGNPQNASLVKDGWTIVRDMTNMLFILILLIIAFATILRKENYGMKALLPKLIGIALLINFSLVIAGAIIDFADAITQTFLYKDEATGEVKLFQEDLPRALMIPAYIDNTGKIDDLDKRKARWMCQIEEDGIYEIAMTQEACESMLDGKCSGHCFKTILETEEAQVLNEEMSDPDYNMNMILGMLLSILFMIIAIFVLAALFFMLIFRVLTLWFLLILMPIALLLWVLPATASMFSRWIHTFFRWTFFAPIVTFFIWLSVTSWIKFLEGSAGAPGGEISVGMSGIAKHKMLAKQVVPQVFLPENLFQFILVCGMLIGSLVVAQKMSIHGASGAISLGKKWGVGAAKKTGGAVGGYTKRKAQRMTAKPAGVVGRGFDRASAWTRKSKLGKYSGLSKGLGKYGAGLSKHYEGERNRINEEKKKYENMSPDHLKSLYKTVTDRRSKIAIGQALAEKGKLKADESRGFTETDIKNLAKYSQTYGMEKNILKTRPELALEMPKQDLDKVISSLKPEDMKNLDNTSIKNSSQVQESVSKQFQEGGNFTSKHLSELYNNNYEVYNTIENEVLNNNYESLRNDIKQFLDKQKESSKEAPVRTRGSTKEAIRDYLRSEAPKDVNALSEMMGTLQPEDVAELSQGFSSGYAPNEVAESMAKQFEEGKGWRADHLNALKQSNPDLYSKVEDTLNQNRVNISKDVRDYMASNPERVILETK